MRKMILATLIFLSTIANADLDLGFRYANAVPPNTGTFSFDPGGQTDQAHGKLVEVTLINFIFNSRYFYIESGVGTYYASDFSQMSSLIGEVSPGVKVEANHIQLKVSQGVAYIPTAPNLTSIEFVTHLSLSLIDSSDKVSIGLERTHFSNGSANPALNPSLDLTGIIFTFKF